MNIRDLRYAVMVADTGHFGRAAAACLIGQPTLSAQIRKLEEELGVTLFERTKRSVAVTPVGETIIAQARTLLDQAALIEETAKASRDPLSGPLRLGMIPTIGPYLTPTLLPALRHGLPNVVLDLSEDMTEVLERRLRDGEIDAAILATEVTDRRLADIKLFDEPFWIALPREHPLSMEDTVKLQAIGSDELLVLEEGHCLADQVVSFCSTAFPETPKVNTQHTSLMTILALVGAGLGVTLVPALSLSGSWVTDSGIALRREHAGKAFRTVRVAFRTSFPRRPLLEKFADIVAASLPDTVSPVLR
ncbi:MAG: LysR substrate-binding domain-containing protein [Rhodospirillaceae bacterium]|nr:LysR substrate-binding domain-containing protein [Rhodospirillaceae bacterium]MDD9918447.1 LysR substrate-binding domain-containing protein [Rhodospirillaceae bacterium]MDD9924231.1 LysR substrate-binding domain-containing protein [Rhodospirillaceae bacterium]